MLGGVQYLRLLCKMMQQASGALPEGESRQKIQEAAEVVERVIDEFRARERAAE